MAVNSSNRVAVTGATGFVGTALVARLLADGFEVTALVRCARAAAKSLPSHARLQLVELESVLGKASSTALQGCSAVLHLASRNHQSGRRNNENDDAFRRDILELSTSLLNASRDAGVARFVYLSTIKAREAADTGDRTPGTSPYSFYKRRTEQMLIATPPDCTTTKVIVVRPPLVYHLDAPGNFRRLVRLARSRWPLVLPNATGRRAMIARANLIDALVNLVRLDEIRFASSSDRIFEIADESGYTLSDVVEGIRKMTGSTSLTLSIPAPPIKLVASMVGLGKLYRITATDLLIDNTAFHEATGWRPPHQWPDGIAI